MDTRGINSVFIRRILADEWAKLKIDQDAAIAAALKRRSGTLHAGGKGRRYSIHKDGIGATATLIHPDYERYQDMKLLVHGRSVYGTEPISKKQGKKIHNKLIWGRMNSIAFRLANDQRMEVIKTVKKSWNGGESKTKTITINS